MKKKLIWILGIALTAVSIFVIVFNYTGSCTSQFKGPVFADEPVPTALKADLEKYVLKMMRQFDVPGAAMVLVQGDEVVYAKGLGVRDLETKQPVTTQTLFGIGSSTKLMTSIMVASLVDDHIIDWDTPVKEILPSFALSNPETTKAVTFMHTLCMCTGFPRRMEEISTQYSELTPEVLIESMATIPLEGDFGRHYAYAERMFSAGGYLAAMAADGAYGNLSQAYTQEMQIRVLEPVGMTSSTLSIDEAVSSGNYATPYYSSLTDYKAIKPEIEGIFTPVAPTGAMWSNADDLGNFLIMLLKGGVSFDGEHVVSAHNLDYLWFPRTTIDGTLRYGLGWNIEDYHGLTVIHHPGGTVGFASELVIIPELDIGFAMVINRLDMTHQMGRMTTYRLLEMLTGNEQVYDREERKTAKKLERQIALLLLLTRKTVNPEAITPFLGSYYNAMLGDVILALHEDNTLWIDFGEYESQIRPFLLEKDQYIFFESVFIGKTIHLKMNPGGIPTMNWSGDEGTYNFVFTP